MKNFEIIEDGRLSKSEMAELTGGDYSCSGVSGAYKVLESCMEGGGWSICPNTYGSCTGKDDYLMCSNYNGPIGPGGYGEVENPYEEAIDPPEDEWAGEG